MKPATPQTELSLSTQLRKVVFRCFLSVQLLVAIAGFHGAGATELVIYPPLPDEPAFEDCSVTVNGKPVFVFMATVNRSAPDWGIVSETVGFASFDFSGEARVTITAKENLKSVEIRPRSRAITSAIQNKTVSFTISQPCKLCLQWNGSDRRPLFLFADAIESYPGGIPKPGQDKVRYFGPGVHQPGEIRPQSGETIYIAGGALVYGSIAADGVRGVRVLGRGILDGSRWKARETNPVAFTNCSDIEIRGIILRDSPLWTVVFRRCEHVTVANVKMLDYRKNTDGIDLVNCRHVTVEDCFVRNYDDSIIVKALDRDADVEEITVRNCVIWCDWGFSLGVTYETRAAYIRGLLFQNCDVLHGMACAGVLGLKIGDRATVRDVCFDDIRVEDARVQLLKLVVDRDIFSKDLERGHIQGVVFRNIALTGGAFVPSTLSGFDADHCVEDVTFDNLRIHGKVVTSTEEGKIQTNAYVKNVRFLPGKKKGNE